METDPKQIYGNWAHGWALDYHTVKSIHEGDNVFGHPQFKTERTELGEALYKLKYRCDFKQIDLIAPTIVKFIRSRHEFSDIKTVLAVPPSDTGRSFQPVEAIAVAVGGSLGLPVPDDYILKLKHTPSLKNIDDKRERREELEGAFAVADQRFAGMHLLLVDDLYRSGETLKAVTATLLFAGKASAVSVIALTATRTRK